MNRMNSVFETGKSAARQFGTVVAGFFGLLAACLLVSAFATLGLAALGVGVLVMTVTLVANALASAGNADPATP